MAVQWVLPHWTSCRPRQHGHIGREPIHVTGEQLESRWLVSLEQKEARVQHSPIGQSNQTGSNSLTSSGLPAWTIVAVIVGKLLIMPAIGIASVMVLRFFLDTPADLAGSVQ